MSAMKCHEFNDNLCDYLDETLSPEALQAAREHLSNCSTCRRALAREQAVTQCLHHSLKAAAAGCSLRPEIRRTVLQASQRRPEHFRPLLIIWRWFRSASPRPIWSCAALVTALITFYAVQPLVRNAITNPSPKTNSAVPPTCVVDVPLPTHNHVFDRQASAVVDFLVPSTALASARITVTPHP